MDLVLPGARRQIGVWLETLERLAAPLRRLPRRTLVLGGVSALLLLIAGIITARSASDDDVPASEFVGFYCPKCDRYFQLSHRQFKRLWDQRAYTRPPGQSSLRFKCDECGQLTALRADRPPTRQ